jgi:hypothetical protein
MNVMLPLSGDVSQVINPWTLWLKYLNQQMGFININNIESGDPETEKMIIEQVAGYGRQLGWILEAVDLLAEKLTAKHALGDLSDGEEKTLWRLSDLRSRIEDLKSRSGHAGPTVQGVDRMIDDIRRLKEKNRASYDEIVARIKDAFAEA